tara:strand:- start:25 stop:531 length:507 start_codon:yes stop_codon:yes gene_type:complete
LKKKLNMKNLFLRFRLFFTYYYKFNNIEILWYAIRNKLNKLWSRLVKYKVVISLNEIKVLKSKNYILLKNITLSRIYCPDGGKEWIDNYNWGRLKKSILKYGLINDIEVLELIPPKVGDNGVFCHYQTLDGAHRLTALKELYGPNHLVNIKVCSKYRLEAVKFNKKSI